jgi:hypothetical protein
VHLRLQETPFFLFLFLPDLWSPAHPRMVQKQTQRDEDQNRTTHTREEATSSKGEVPFFSVYFKRTKNQPQILYKNMALELW